MGEGSSVRVPDGSVLRESEIDGAVSERKGRHLNGADGDLGILRLENGEVNGENDDEEEN